LVVSKPTDTKSIGQLTSHIANKQKRSEAYAKLKHKKQVLLHLRLSPPTDEIRLRYDGDTVHQ
jgi:hypothetical protein